VVPADRHGGVDPTSPQVRAKAIAALDTLEALGVLADRGSATDPGWWDKLSATCGTLQGQAAAVARALRGRS
jgi:hypothetical protein